MRRALLLALAACAMASAALAKPLPSGPGKAQHPRAAPSSRDERGESEVGGEYGAVRGERGHVRSGTMAPPADALADACATRPGLLAETLEHHHARRLDAPLPTPHSTDVGEIAVLENDGTFFYLDKNDRPRVDMASVGRAFYRTHGDDYDALAVYLASGLDHWLGSPGALASAMVVRNAIAGIGIEIADAGVEFGSAARLQVVLSMNGLHRYPADPHANIGADEYSTLDVLAHELGHRWSSYVQVDSAGFAVPVLLGRGEQHWSFFLDAHASLMDGNAWTSPAPDSFLTTASTLRFSPLDQYLMGLRSAFEVPPFFTLHDGQFFDPPGIYVPWTSPRTGVSCHARAETWTVDDIVAVHGPREPDAASAPHDFRMAVVLLVPRGQGASAADLAQLEDIRSRFTDFFFDAVEGRGSMDVTLDSRAGQVAIAHTPLPDVTDEFATPPVAARVTIEQAGIPIALVPASVRVHVRAGSAGPFDPIPMAPAGPDSFAALLPPRPGGGVVEYYLEAASDSAGIVSFDPPLGPLAPHAYTVGPDATPPTIAHVPVATQAVARLPERLIAIVRDNVGVDSVWARHGPGLTQSAVATRTGRDSFVVWLGAGLIEGGALPYRFEARDASGLVATGPTHALVAGRDWTFDFENGSSLLHGSWWYSYRDAWHLSHEQAYGVPDGSATAWKCGSDVGVDYPPHLDAVLELPLPATIAPGAALTFAHRYGLEARDETFAWDGVRIEAQVGAGPWAPLEPDAGYSHQFLVNSNPFQSGTPCWSGASGGWREERVDLSGLAPGPARLRFRMLADEWVGGEGWFVDHVRIDVPGGATRVDAAVAGRVAPWPNPARGTLAWRLPVLPAGAEVTWTLHDLAGRQVVTLWRGAAAPGLEIRGSTAALPAGLYFARLTAAGGTVATARVALVH